VIRQEVAGNHFTFIARAHYEIPDAMAAQNFHDVPNYRFTTNFNHRLGAKLRFFPHSSAQTSGKYNCPHEYQPFELN
jgi:hypothetical protein